MNLLLSRHGNTFNPGEPSVWTGSANDLPLVAKGVAQAEQLAQALAARGVKPVDVYCSPLQRTARYAATVIERLGLRTDAVVDPRLNEIDYGDWTGLTNEEVKARFGAAALQAWDERCEWPREGDWGGSADQALTEARSFFEDLERRYSANDPVLVVTSNGRLRYFLKLVPAEFARRVADGSFKVKTGHVCGLARGADGTLRVRYWNASPSEADL